MKRLTKQENLFLIRAITAMYIDKRSNETAMETTYAEYRKALLNAWSVGLVNTPSANALSQILKITYNAFKNSTIENLAHTEIAIFEKYNIK